VFASTTPSDLPTCAAAGATCDSDSTAASINAPVNVLLVMSCAPDRRFPNRYSRSSGRR
jgi:hypothetical protein